MCSTRSDEVRVEQRATTMDINVNDFATREDLENTVKNTQGAVSIKGTTEELARLNLSHGSIVYEVPCIALNYTPKEPVEKPNRGEVFESSLN